MFTFGSDSLAAPPGAGADGCLPGGEGADGRFGLAGVAGARGGARACAGVLPADRRWAVASRGRRGLWRPHVGAGEAETARCRGCGGRAGGGVGGGGGGGGLGGGGGGGGGVVGVGVGGGVPAELVPGEGGGLVVVRGDLRAGGSGRQGREFRQRAGRLGAVQVPVGD